MIDNALGNILDMFVNIKWKYAQVKKNTPRISEVILKVPKNSARENGRWTKSN